MNTLISETTGINDVILNCDFSQSVIETFLTNNPHIPRWCDWKELNIPGITNSSLGGSAINTPSDYNRFNEHGLKNQYELL